MAQQDNINVVRKFFDYLNKNDMHQLNACDAIFSQDVKFIDPATSSMGSNLKALKQAEGEYIKAFPNKRTHIDSLFAADDKVCVRWTSSGSQKGSYCGHPPSNKHFTISGISVYRLTNGKIVEVSQVWDRMGLLEQLGELRQSQAA